MLPDPGLTSLVHSRGPALGLGLAAAAAVFGVLLGGAAVFMGIQQAPTVAPVLSPAVASPGPLALLPELPAQAGDAGEAREQTCSQGQTLVEAVAATRETVVTLRSKDTVGAGVVVDETGLVLTNFHVIAGEIRDPSPSASRPCDSGDRARWRSARACSRSARRSASITAYRRGSSPRWGGPTSCAASRPR